MTFEFRTVPTDNCWLHSNTGNKHLKKTNTPVKTLLQAAHILGRHPVNLFFNYAYVKSFQKMAWSIRACRALPCLGVLQWKSPGAVEYSINCLLASLARGHFVFGLMQSSMQNLCRSEVFRRWSAVIHRTWTVQSDWTVEECQLLYGCVLLLPVSFVQKEEGSAWRERSAVLQSDHFRDSRREGKRTCEIQSGAVLRDEKIFKWAACERQVRIVCWCSSSTSGCLDCMQAGPLHSTWAENELPPWPTAGVRYLMSGFDFDPSWQWWSPAPERKVT